MWRELRPVDWVALAYFGYTTVLALVLPVEQHITVRTLLVNTVVVAFLFSRLLLTRRWHYVVHNFLMLALMLTGYKEMGWFALPHQSTDLEQSWVVWDRWLLDSAHFRAVLESLGPAIPIVLEIAYTLVYATGVISLIFLYAHDEGRKIPAFLFCLLLGTFAAYALFPYFPSEPPRTVFPNEDLPTYRPVFRAFNYWLLGNWGIHTSVFPSAHVSSAFSAAFGLRRFLTRRQWPWRFMAALATLIATSTVYGRYHYLVDALAGFAIAVGAALATRWVAGSR
ncbi:MAG: phosphatase PAP2 family protein [Bryobacterales bacterium]|nr:phosphatase PAP2 family protein [Bryobacterales bacterium]